MNIGKNYMIHSYKHNGSIHRSWDEARLLDIKDDYMVFGNNRTKVTEADGRSWNTKEPAILYFYNNCWFNVIAQIKEDGIYYYCNIASPYIIEDDTIKYIDYDLDLRVFPDNTYKVLDKGEYKYHMKKMEYPKELDKILKNELNALIEVQKEKKGPFNTDEIANYIEKYKEISKSC